ncbi:MAG TPA: GNAT family N-acetyltransferase [Stellaceae bacterium]|nr:GNAT family N-acetyltransferase [Stellaceae bacterium]
MIEVRRLEAAETAAFASFTFPLLRPLLDHERPVRPVMVGARAEDDPVGLSVGLAAPNRQFELLSLYVAPLWRGQGVGERLLLELEKHYRAEGCVLGAHFLTIKEEEPEFARFLMRHGWGRPTIRQVICQTTTELILASPLRAFARLPRGYRIIGWEDVTPAQKDAIRERTTREPGWYPDQLDPFVHERDALMSTSIALVHGDTVVGWLFSHILDDNTLRMTCSFVAKELERVGRVLHLWWEAGVRQDAYTSMKRTIWTVPVAYGGHVQFVIKHVKPWMETFSYACTSIKRFDEPPVSATSDQSS